jgi:hypothetical protein
MARGDSGRIVIEVGPDAKKQLYAALDLAGSTLKDWFVKRAADFCAETTQPSLFDLGNGPIASSNRQNSVGANVTPTSSGARKGKIQRKRPRSHLTR